MVKSSNLLFILIMFILSAYIRQDTYNYDQLIMRAGYYYKFNNTTPEYVSMINELNTSVSVQEGNTKWDSKKIETNYKFFIKNIYTREEYRSIMEDVKDVVKTNAYLYNMKHVDIFLEKIYSDKDYFKIVLIY